MKDPSSVNNPKASWLLGLFFLSAATLAFEINLTRLFSVAQFYHFAFMIVSVALLGYGISGTALTLIRPIPRQDSGRALTWLCLGSSLTIQAAYIVTNWLPFDSYTITLGWKQPAILILHYFVLALPFFFNGLATGVLLTAFPRQSRNTYAVNLCGSALGCILSFFLPSYFGGEGMVAFCSGLSLLSAWMTGYGRRPIHPITSRDRLQIAALLLLGVGLAVWDGADLGNWLITHTPSRLTAIHLSPYKSLSYALQYPDAEVVYRKWNSYSRVDLVSSSGFHALPGLSFRYLERLPVERGLFVDGDDLNPVILSMEDADFLDYLASAVAYRLRPGARVLVLEPRGGVDILAGLRLGAKHVTAVEANPLIVEAAGEVYRLPNVDAILENGRSFLRRTTQEYDLIFLSLIASFHPIRSGAYSLSEDFRYTLESFSDALNRLNPEGLLVVTRWIQDPPSECLRTFTTAVETLEKDGGNPRAQIVAYRSYNTMTFLVKKTPFTSPELDTIRHFALERAFDLVYAPDIRPEETNRFSVLPNSIYYQTFIDYLDSEPRETFYRRYPFDVSPSTDDHPFFNHFFKWSQLPTVISEIGKTWQPFGGVGYLVVVILLAVSMLLSGIIVLLPAVFKRERDASIEQKPVGHTKHLRLGILLYFAFIGLAYLLVEIPLIQRYTLYLGHPAYALAVVLFSLLLFSGLGSSQSQRLSIQVALGILVLLIWASPVVYQWIDQSTLLLSLSGRVLVAFISLSPLGLLMGIPFPAGLEQATRLGAARYLIAWAWAVNGAASVISSVLAALLAISFGFSWVLRIGAISYLGALLVMAVWLQAQGSARLHP